MKLKKENFNKSVNGETITYSYECEGMKFFIVSSGGRNDRKISVYKEVEGKKEEELNTSDSLEGWNHFEKLLEECSPEQSSSGGFDKNPQQNPNILPLLAIERMSDGRYQGCLFAQLEDKTQVKIFDFFVDSDAMPSVIPNDVFIVDWSDEEVNMMLKCEIAMKKSDIEFEEDKQKQVFLFIPKSITAQGGGKDGEEEDGEGEEQEGEEGKEKGGDKKGKPSDKKGGEPSDEDGGEPSDEEGGEPSDKKGKPSNKKGKPTDKKSEPSDEEGGEPSDEEGGEPSDKEGKPSDKKGKPTDKKDDSKEGEGEPTDDEEQSEEGKPSDKESKPKETQESNTSKKQDTSKGEASQQMLQTDFGESVQKISEVTGVPSSSVVSFFRTPTMGESFLRSANFNKIKQELNLPNITPRQLSEQIINSKKN